MNWKKDCQRVRLLIMFNFNTSPKSKDIFRISNNIFKMSDFETNSIIFGGTGSGKTKTLILPILNEFLRRGMAGLIIDVKNNFTDNVYSIADRYGKSDRIVEIGSFNTSENVNIINDINIEMLIQVLKESALEIMGEGNNSSWVQKGIDILDDILNVYYILHRNNIVEKPTLYIIARIVNDRMLANKLYEKFNHNKHLYSEEYHETTQSIKARVFHVFTDYGTNRKDEQLEWTLGNISRILKPFTKKDNITKFSNINNNDFSLDFDDFFYKKRKIIILRFSEDTDSVLSKIVAKLILRKQKKDVMLSKRSRRTFRMIDEYQNIIDANEDNKWLDKCREFKNIQIFATQSLQSLLATSTNKDAIYTLVDNCKNKFFLNSNNPTTNTYFEDISISKSKLPKSLSFNGGKRECIYNNGKLQKNINLNFDFYENLKPCKREEAATSVSDELEIYQNVLLKYHDFLDSNTYYKQSYVEKLIKNVDIKKPNGIVDNSYIDLFYEKFIVIKDSFNLELIKSTNRTVEKELNLAELNINIIKPTTDITTYNDFYSGFLESLLNLNVGVLPDYESSKSLNAKSLTFNKYKNEMIDYISSNKNKNDFYPTSFSNINNVETMTHQQFKQSYFNSKFEDTISDKLKAKDTINIFIIGGNYDFVAIENKSLLEAIKYFTLLPKLKSLIVLGLGHSDFIHPINTIVDFSYNTPDGVGTRLMKDMSNARDGHNLKISRIQCEYF